MKILLVNVHSSWNAGDNLLTEEALRQMSMQFPDATFTLAMNDPASYSGEWPALPSFTAWVHPMDRQRRGFPWRWHGFLSLAWHSLIALTGYRLTGRPWVLWASPAHRALVEAYLEADLVVSTAGNFLFSSGIIGIPFLLALFTIYFGILAGRPVYTLPQSLGPIRRRREVVLIRHVLSRCGLVLIRDAVSLEVWKGWHVPRVQGVLVPDLALGRVPEDCRSEALLLLEDHGIRDKEYKPWLGVTAVNWGAMNRSFTRQAHYEQAMTAAIRDFVGQTGGRAILFVQVHGPDSAQDDRVPSRRILECLSDMRDRVTLVDTWVPPRLLKAAMGQTDLFLGTRLHSNLFALTEGVPVVAVGYQYKTRGILRMLDLEEWMVDIGAARVDTLVPLLRRAWERHEDLRAHLGARLLDLRRQTSQAGILIAQDYRAQHPGLAGKEGR